MKNTKGQKYRRKTSEKWERKKGMIIKRRKKGRMKKGKMKRRRRRR